MITAMLLNIPTPQTTVIRFLASRKLIQSASVLATLTKRDSTLLINALLANKHLKEEVRVLNQLDRISPILLVHVLNKIIGIRRSRMNIEIMVSSFAGGQVSSKEDMEGINIDEFITLLIRTAPKAQVK